MKSIKLIAALLIVVGMIASVYEEVTGTASGAAPNLAPLAAMHEEGPSIPAPPPFLGILAVAGGVAFLIASRGRERSD